MQLGATSLEFLGNLLEKTEKTGGFFFVFFFFLNSREITHDYTKGGRNDNSIATLHISL